MSVSNYEQEVYGLLCSFYERHLRLNDLNERLVELTSNHSNSIKVRSLKRRADAVLLNERSMHSLVTHFSDILPADRRLELLHMRGLTHNLMKDCGVQLFHPQKKKGSKAELPRKQEPRFMPDLQGHQNAIQAAAILNTGFSILQKGGGLLAPPEELAWYHYAPYVDDNKETYRPLGNIPYFSYGRTHLEGSNIKEIGITSLCLGNGFREITYTVDQSIRDVENWEDLLIRFAALRQLAGPSIFLASRMILHSGHHRVYTMIWPVGYKSFHKTGEKFYLRPFERVLLYSRIFSPGILEASFYSGRPQEPPQTIKYPQPRKSEVLSAMKRIGIHVVLQENSHESEAEQA